MTLEVAILQIKTGKTKEFEQAFNIAQNIIKAARGYIGHNLQKSSDYSDRYILIVKWQTLDDHINEFRKSPEYQDWKKLLHHYYEPFPEVDHFQKIDSSSTELIL
ncbi:MAG: antibiotic biosynthesis monooxygenase [Rickettsiales bacterium]|nr:antibiotic biosynthesis monooxygenase [Rickettsiales bacterium]